MEKNTKDKEKPRKMEQIVQWYKDIISGVSKYEGPQVKIQFPRRIPVHFTHLLEVNLKDLVE